jgi:hypothetical protein
MLCTVASSSTGDALWLCENGTACNNIGDVDVYLDEISAMTIAAAEEWMREKAVKVQYILATPIETDLSTEEKALYATLRTNDSITHIFNDANAYQEVAYYTPNSALPVTGGSLGGNLNMTGHHITNVADPTDPKDAVNKEYIDSHVGECSRTLVWMNGAPNSSFANQSIVFNTMDKFDGFEIIYSPDGAVYNLCSTGFIPGYVTTPLWGYKLFNSSTAARCQRIVTFEENGMNFGMGAKAAMPSDSTQQDDTVCIPFKIYGIKGVRQ